MQPAVRYDRGETVFLVFGNRGWVLRFGALAYLANALFAVIRGGWHAVSWIGWLLMALGFFALSLADERSQPYGLNWRSPAFSIGLAVTIAGAGLLVYSWLR